MPKHKERERESKNKMQKINDNAHLQNMDFLVRGINFFFGNL